MRIDGTKRGPARRGQKVQEDPNKVQSLEKPNDGAGGSGSGTAVADDKEVLTKGSGAYLLSGQRFQAHKHGSGFVILPRA